MIRNQPDMFDNHRYQFGKRLIRKRVLFLLFGKFFSARISHGGKISEKLRSESNEYLFSETCFAVKWVGYLANGDVVKLKHETSAKRIDIYSESWTRFHRLAILANYTVVRGGAVVGKNK